MEHRQNAELKTERLVLRPVAATDAQDIYVIYKNPGNVKYLRLQPLETLSDAEALIESILSGSPHTYFWTITLEGKVIGTIALLSESEQDEICTVAFCLDGGSRHMGYAKEALLRVIEFAFLDVGYNRLQAVHAAGNPDSGRTMRAAGMLYEGMMREGYKNALGYHDANIYAILKKDFKIY